MSALPVPSSTTPPAPDRSRWVPIDVAADRMEKDEGNLRRRCRLRLGPAGLAFLATPPEGGPEKWYLSPTVDARLLGGPIGQLHREPDLVGFTLQQQIGARQRRQCVESLREARRSNGAAVSEWLPSLIAELRGKFPQLNVSRSQLYRWDAVYVRPADLVKLVDQRGGNRRGQDSPEAWDRFRDLYLHQNRLTLALAHAQVAAEAEENGWKWCSLKSCYAQRDKRIAPQMQVANREPEKYRRHLRPSIAQAPEAWPAGERWVSDHKQLDLWCLHGGTIVRPWLTTWQDWRTRRICGWVLSEQPNSHTIRAALHHGLSDPLNMGGPSEVLTDNGKDFDAWVFHGQTKSQRRARVKPAADEAETSGIFNLLGIEAHFSLPYNPTSKSRMERWFRTLEAFCKCFDSYAGESVESRPENLNRVLADRRRVPTFQAVKDRLASYIAGYNADADHAKADLAEGGVKLSPDEAMARWCRRVRQLADPAVLELLLAQHHKPATVGKNGISLCLGGATIGYGNFSVELAPYKARRAADRPKLIVTYDPHDLRSIRVYDPAGGRLRFVCAASMNDECGACAAGPVSQKHVAETKRRQAEYERSERHVAEHALSSVLTTQERLAAVVAEEPLQATGTDDVAPPAIRIVQTPADGEARHVRRAELRESMRPAVAASSAGAGSPGGGPSLADRLLEMGRREREARAAREATERPARVDWTDPRLRRNGDGR